MNIDTIMNPRTVTPGETKAALAAVIAVTETVRQAGRVPSGVLYAVLCDRMDLPAFEKMLQIIVGTGLVKRDGHELVWIGPVIQ